MTLVIELPAELKWISNKISLEKMVSCKYLFGKGTAVWEKTHYLTNVVYSEKKMDSCYFFSSPENSWTYVKQVWCYKGC